MGIFPSADRLQLPAPLETLDQIQHMPGASAQPTSFRLMSAAIPHVRLWLLANTIQDAVQGSEQDMGKHMRIDLVGQLILDRVAVSLDVLKEAVADEIDGRVPPMADKPLAEREFSFSEIVYLACKTMVEMGGIPDTDPPDERARQNITDDVLLAAPAVGLAFNDVLVRANRLATTRRSTRKVNRRIAPKQRRPTIG